LPDLGNRRKIKETTEQRKMGKKKKMDRIKQERKGKEKEGKKEETKYGTRTGPN
jgi:hypothetical protein